MSDGQIDIELKLEDGKAKSSGQKAGKDIAKGVESGLKDVSKAANNVEKNIEKPLQNAAKNAKSSFNDVGNAAKSGFANVGDAAKTAADDAASAFENIPADAAGAFSDVGSQAQSGFDGVADAASTASSDAASAFENIPADAAGAFSDVSSEAQAGFSGVADAAKTAADDAAGAFSGVSEAAGQAGKESSEAFGIKTVAAGNLAADAIEAAASAVGDFVSNSINVGKEFDKSMSQVAATMGKTTDEIGELTDFAKEMGASTAFSATQASEALNYMALAGYDAKTSMEMLPVVLNLAAAGNMELATASDMVTDAQSALGLSLDETVQMVDQMAMTSSKTNTSVEQLGNAFLTVGGTAKNLSGGTKELAQMLGILADNGIKGSEGGTALRNVILSLSAPTDVAAKKIEELGLAVFDAEGNMRPLPDIMNDLNSSMEPLTQQDKTEALNTIFNKVDLKSVNALLGTSSDRFNEVASSIDNATGSAQKMADTQLDNFAGDVTLLDSAMEGLSIQVSDKLNPALRGFTQWLTNSVVPATSFLVANLDKVIPLVGSFGASLLILKVVPSIMNSMKTSTAGATTTVKLLGREFTLTGTSAKVASVATKAFGTAANALKSALPVLALTAAIEGLTMLTDAMKDAQEKSENFNKATEGIKNSMDAYNEAFSSARSSMDGVSDSSSKVTASFADIRNAADDAVKKTAELADSLNESFSEVGTNNAMVQNYADTIEELANKSNLTAEEQGALINAVSGLNDIMGTSYSVVDAQNGILSANTDEILASADAWQKRALMEAQAAASSEIMKQMVENTTALTKAEDVLATTQQKLSEAEARGEQDLTQYRLGVEQAQAEVDRLTGVQEGLEQEQLDLNMAVAKLNDELNSSADSIKSYAEGTEAWSSALQNAGVDAGEFANKLSEIGVSTEDLSRIMSEKGAEGIQGFINAYQQGGDSLANWMRSEMGVELGEAAQEAGSQAGQGLSEGLSDSAQLAIDAAIATVGMTRDEFDKLAEQAGIEGEEAAVEFAKQIAAGADESERAGQENADAANDGFDTVDGETPGNRGVTDFYTQIRQSVPISNQAGTENADAATEGFETVDGETPGKEGGQEYASGIESASGQAKSAGEKDAQAAGTGMQSQNSQASTWGGHLVQNFAQGISNAISFVTSAASAVAGAVASILHFSAPKKGVWSGAEKGGIRSGLHLAENFADGIKKGRSAVEKRAAALAQTVKDYIGHSKPKKGALSEGEWIYGVHLVNNFSDGMKSGMSELDSTAKSMSDMLKEHIESMAKMWKPLDMSIVLPSTGEVNSVFSALTKGAREYTYALPTSNDNRVFDDLITGSNAAVSMTNALEELTNRGIALSYEFIEAFAKGKDEYIDMLYDMEHWTNEDIQAMSDYFRDLSYAEREAELAQRALEIQSNALSKTVFNVKGAWLDYYNTVLDVCEVISSNDGLNYAMQRAGINVNDLAADLQALDVSMNEFVQGMESFTSKVADGFSAMSSFGKTGLEDWQTNLKNNMAEAQQYAANLEKVFSNISPDIDSEAFRKAVYQGGFDKWAGVISDLAKSSAGEIEEIVNLYNQAVAEGSISALQQFEAVAPGEEYVAALSEAIMASSEEFTDALENCVDEGIDVLDDSLPEFESAGASMSGAIAAGIDSQVSAIAASAAAAVRAAIAAARAAANEGGQAVAQELSDGMAAQFQSIDAMGQIQTSLTNGLGVMNMNAQVNGGVSKSFAQTNNYYAPTTSPDIIARNQRLDAMYGLAGQWIG